MASETGKADKIHRLYEAAMLLLLKGGTQKLTHGRLALAAGVSRSWIYKYMGTSHQELVSSAVKYFGRAFVELDSDSGEEHSKLLVAEPSDPVKEFLDGTERVFEKSARYPWIVQIYFRYRGTQTLIGQEIARIEDEYLRSLAKEIARNFKVTEQRGTLVADSLISFRLGLLFRWHSAGLKDRAEVSQLVDVIGVCLRTLMQG